MATSMAIFSAISNISNPKIPTPDVGFRKIRFSVRKGQTINRMRPINPISIPDASPLWACSYTSPTVTNSLALDRDEELKLKSGSKVRVKLAVKVHHVPKVPELDLRDRTGVFKQYVGVYNGKRISVNLPYKVEFVADEVLGRDGEPVKFVAHLRDGEFEFVD